MLRLPTRPRVVPVPVTLDDVLAAIQDLTAVNQAILNKLTSWEYDGLIQAEQLTVSSTSTPIIKRFEDQPQKDLLFINDGGSTVLVAVPYNNTNPFRMNGGTSYNPSSETNKPFTSFSLLLAPGGSSVTVRLARLR